MPQGVPSTVVFMLGDREGGRGGPGAPSPSVLGLRLGGSELRRCTDLPTVPAEVSRVGGEPHLGLRTKQARRVPIATRTKFWKGHALSFLGERLSGFFHPEGSAEQT